MEALVTDCDENGNATLSLRNKMYTGEEVEVVGPNCRPFAMTVPELRESDGAAVEEIKTPRTIFQMKLPRPVPPLSLVRHAVELSAR